MPSSLQQILADREAAGEMILCLVGTLIHTDGVAAGKSLLPTPPMTGRRSTKQLAVFRQTLLFRRRPTSPIQSEW